jgi:hypothetical protein
MNVGYKKEMWGMKCGIVIPNQKVKIQSIWI